MGIASARRLRPNGARALLPDGRQRIVGSDGTCCPCPDDKPPCNCPPGLLSAYLLTGHYKTTGNSPDVDCDFSLVITRPVGEPGCVWGIGEVDCPFVVNPLFGYTGGITLTLQPRDPDTTEPCSWQLEFSFSSFFAPSDFRSEKLTGSVPTGLYPDISRTYAGSGGPFSYEFTNMQIS